MEEKLTDAETEIAVRLFRACYAIQIKTLEEARHYVVPTHNHFRKFSELSRERAIRLLREHQAIVRGE